MIKIINKRAESMYAECGGYVYNAEITIEENDKILYIHASSFDFTIYTVSEKSIYDKMTQCVDDGEDIKFLEEYDEIEATKSSKYAKYFEMLEEMIEAL